MLLAGRLHGRFILINGLIDDMSSTASVGGHASDFSLAIHFHAIGWSLPWSLACLTHSLIFHLFWGSGGCLRLW